MHINLNYYLHLLQLAKNKKAIMSTLLFGGRTVLVGFVGNIKFYSKNKVAIIVKEIQ